MHGLESVHQPEHAGGLLQWTIQALIAQHEVVAVALHAGEGASLGIAAQEFLHLAGGALAAARGVALDGHPARAALDAGGQLQAPGAARPAGVHRRLARIHRPACSTAPRRAPACAWHAARSRRAARSARAAAGRSTPRASRRDAAAPTGVLVPHILRAIAQQRADGRRPKAGTAWVRPTDGPAPVTRGKNISASVLWKGQSARPSKATCAVVQRAGGSTSSSACWRRQKRAPTTSTLMPMSRSSAGGGRYRKLKRGPSRSANMPLRWLSEPIRS